MKSLIEENFDPNTHSSIQDFDQIISGETAIDNNNIDNNEDVQFEKVCYYWSYCRSLCVIVCVLGSSISKMSIDWMLS